MKKILIVDDDPSVISLIEKALKAEGFALLQASSAQEALTKFENYAPDIVLLDIGLPGADGLVALRRIRSISKGQGYDVRIIMVTSHHTKEDVKAALEAGANDFIAKPFDLGILREKVLR